MGTLFRKRVVTASIGTYIRRVLVNDGYLCSRVYGILGICNLKFNIFLSGALYLESLMSIVPANNDLEFITQRLP